MIGVHCCTMATPTTAKTPRLAPIRPPSRPITTDSRMNWEAICRRVAPSARRRPISPTRSMTPSMVTLAMPRPPASSATMPSTRKTTFTSACTLSPSSLRPAGAETSMFSGAPGESAIAACSATCGPAPTTICTCSSPAAVTPKSDRPEPIGITTESFRSARRAMSSTIPITA